MTNYKIGLAWWSPGDEIGSSIASTLHDLGHQTVNFQAEEKLPEAEIIFAFGPFGSLTPIVNQLDAYPAKNRPKFIWWITEQLPNPEIPEVVRYPASIFRSSLDRACYVECKPKKWVKRPGTDWILDRGNRYRYYGDLYWLKKKNILSVLATPSQWVSDFLRPRGFDPVVACISSNPGREANLDLKRDIPVLWLGKVGSKRRERLLRRVRSELSERGIEMLVIDGVENPYVFGEERSQLLNRTKISLNLLREKWDDNSLRYYFTAENHVLNISEPTLPHSPFKPGEHIVEAPVDQLTDTICYYLTQDEELRKITASAYKLVTRDLTLEISLTRILGRLTRKQSHPQGFASVSLEKAE